MVTLLLLFAALPMEAATVDRVDLIEVNHYYDAQGRHVIDQLIFWDWDRDRFQIRAWRLIKNESQLPTRDWDRDQYVCYWRDLTQLRKVYAPQKRETWTNYDPEVLEREIYPRERRQELSRTK
ncbi:hypothetical protein LOC68_09810 [Blastopirellula sp. JC732]|uniref:DUF3836 domain-containing protein n=1 Tax=Blastopirellula sediminis TaxID=2894196 RepID=A0A9X1SFT3_9BACT|nr:hypothetical protein [Blastopirellula sediminis]MCC9608530.1 hypothetical protein [Blastopirellula sediminis]MCC9628693.1 hypothetical protein [Blastopirellula sediminis]